ncbi:hypothetical protein AYO44_11820 [Planctomycetaceae bacterium SCGC AG-212-F19]|nr:hypothetical protein AYO44_11820 [Planctomycetaceae bacterium SCGC AG-212-F19]
MPDVKWSEPAAFKRNFPKPTPLIDKACHIRFGVVTLVVLLLRLLLGGGENQVGWGTMLLIALMTGVAFGYVVPLLIKIGPTTVVVSDKGINTQGFSLISEVWPAIQQTFYDWQTFTVASVDTIKAGEENYRVLHMKDPTGKCVAMIALSKKMDEAALRTKFSEHGKQVQIK